MGHRVATLLLALISACGESASVPAVPPAPAALPPLPGVPEGSREWSWRDVIGRPLPGEPAPKADVLALQPASARMDALAALVAAHDPAAAATLLAALDDKQIAVAAEAARLLAEGGYQVGLPRLLLGLGPYPVDYDVPPAVRCAESAALARLGNPAGVPLILTVLAEVTPLQVSDNDLPWPRTERVVYLQELALPGLVALAGTDFGYVPGAPVPAREEALRKARAWWDEHRVALWSAAPADDPTIAARVHLVLAHLSAYQLRQVDGARFVLTNLGPNVLPLLAEGLSSSDTYIRVHALEVMERIAPNCDDKARVRLANLAAGPLLHDASLNVAAQAAAACGAARVADQLIVALQQRNEPEVTIAVLDALGKTGLPVARDALAAFAAGPRAAQLSPDGRVALEAARLGADPARDPAEFLALLASPDTELAFAALQRLMSITGKDWGVDPGKPPEQRTAALAAARTALLARGSAH
jgi:hypothetical protein